MKKLADIVTIIVLVLALEALIYGFVSSHYIVYHKPDPRDEGKLSTFDKKNQSQLMREMCYDAIVTDAKGNLINEGRKAACLR